MRKQEDSLLTYAQSPPEITFEVPRTYLQPRALPKYRHWPWHKCSLALIYYSVQSSNSSDVTEPLIAAAQKHSWNGFAIFYRV